MSIEKTTAIAFTIRQKIFQMAIKAGGGHVPSALSMTDIMSVLYFGEVLRYDPKKPSWQDRDTFILSKGHACLALYATLAQAGYFPEEQLMTFGEKDSALGGHPKINELAGVEASTGSLGHGLLFAIGIAIADKFDKNSRQTYVVMGDGECQEGSVWEGFMSAPMHELSNLTVVIDYNKLQAMDKLESILRLEPLAEKLTAFGWQVLEIDGHNHQEIYQALQVQTDNKPKMIIAHTTKGKGISFMENEAIWHYRMPNAEEMQQALMDLQLEGASL